MQKILIGVGILLIITGVLWPVVGKIPFGRLPGDIIIRKENFTFFFPVTTMILLSVIISGLLWFIQRFRS